MDKSQSVNDATAQPTLSSTDAASLSRYAQSLGGAPGIKNEQADKMLPPLQITDDSKPSTLRQTVDGAGQIAGALAQGVGDTISTAYDSVTGTAGRTFNALKGAFENPSEAANGGASLLQKAQNATISGVSDVSSFADKAVSDPAAVLSDMGHAMGSAASTAADAVAGTAENVGGWIVKHPLQTAAIAGAAVVEVASIGTATPLLAGIGAVGAASLVHTSFSLADALDKDSPQLSTLMNADTHSQSDVAQARQKVAADTGGDLVSLGASAIGMAAAKGISALRLGFAGAPAEEAGTEGGSGAQAAVPAEVQTVVANPDGGTPPPTPHADVSKAQPVARPGAQPGQPEQPAQPAQPGQPGQPAQPAQPAQPGAHSPDSTVAPPPHSTVGRPSDSAVVQPPGPSQNSLDVATKPSDSARPAGTETSLQPQFQSAPVTDTSWHNIYETQFPDSERQAYGFFTDLSPEGSMPHVKLQLSKVDGQTAAFSMTSDYGDLGGTNGQGLLLPYVAVDKDLQGQGIGGAHLNNLITAAKNDYPTAKGMVIEVEDPNAPGISAEDVAQRNQRIDFYTKRGSVMLDRPYAIPVEGGEPLPGRLLWQDFGRGGLSDDGMNSLISRIYQYGYGLQPDDPLMQNLS